jgi:long-subunit fatty acid transport protein
MQQTILLDSNENTRKIEREEQGRFVFSVLTAFGLQDNPTWDWDGRELTTEQQIKMRKLLAAYKFEIVDDMDGGVKIYCEQELVGEFKKPHYVLRKDSGQVNPDKKLYLEMKIDTWSVLETKD